MATLNLKEYANVADGYIGYKDGSFFYSSSSDVTEVVASITQSSSDTYLNEASYDSKGRVTSVSYDGSKSWFIHPTPYVSEIDLGSGADQVDWWTPTADNVRVNTGAGNDQVLASNITGSADINTGTGNDYVNFSSAEKNLNIETGDGSDTVNAGNLNGETTIDTGDGNDGIYLKGIVGAKTTVKAGAGSDTVRAVGGITEELTIDLGDGADHLVTAGSETDITITGSGKDAKTLQINGAVNGKLSIELADGNDTLTGLGQTISGSVNLGAGQDSVDVSGLKDCILNAGADNDYVHLAYTEDSSVYGGSGNDTVDVRSGSAKNSLVDLGEGNDSLIVTLTDGELTVATGEGNDTIDLTVLGSGGLVTLTDLDLASDVVVYSGTIDYLGNDGVISLSGGGQAKVSETNGFYAANFKSAVFTGRVAWSGENATLIDASSMTESIELYGSHNDAADTLIGGSKSDHLFVDEGDVAYGGAGNDSIKLLSSANTREYVGLTKSGGKDTVSGFQAVSGSYDGDVIYLFENSLSDLKMSVSNKTDLVVKVGNASLTLASLNGGKAINEAKLNVRDSSGATTEVSYVQGAVVINNPEEMSNIYYAEGKSSLSMADFSTVSDDLVVDLGNTGIFENTGLAYYTDGFASVKGGSNATILMGKADEKETLIAGSGDTTLWGGGKKSDLLYGNKSSDTAVTYYFTAGDGKDSIGNGDWGSTDEDDLLYLGNASISSIKNDGTNTTVALNTAGDKLTLLGFGSSNTDTILKYTTDGSEITKIKVGVSGKSNVWTYHEDVKAYFGGTGNTLKVGSDVDTADIWLDGSKGTTYEGVKIVDASSSSGTLVIAGTSAKESLIAGKGETSLWGGAGNDTLKGISGGTTEFYFGMGDGTDVITGTYSDDKVVLYNVALSDIASLDDSKSGIMKIQLNDGSKLTINSMSSSSVHTFQLGDGSTWSYNYSKKTWSQA